MPDSLMGSLSGSRDDFLFEVNNMRLMVASDKKLIEHFNTVKSKLDSILLITKALAASKKGHWTFDQKSELKTALQNVLVSYVTNGDGAIITFQIGGMIDNSVGYFYCENPSAVPKMTNNGFIMIRELAQGWYLFKTT